MASTDVFHMSCVAGHKVSVCMKVPFLEPSDCLNAPQLFINISSSSLALLSSGLHCSCAASDLHLLPGRLEKAGFCYLL